MHVTYGTRKQHAEKLKQGLERLSPNFVAKLCYWCEGETFRHFTPCNVCGAGKLYGFSLGLLINNKPAPDSVVNQVLVAAE